MNKPRPNDFAWAHGPKANLKEPFDDLKARMELRRYSDGR